MAEITGKGGSITFAGIVANVYSWNIDDAPDIHEKTDFADGANNYKTRMAGLNDWSATIEARYDSINTADPGDSAALTLTIVSGSTYTGTAMLVSQAVNTPVDDLVTVTYNFVGNGALTRPA